MVETRNTIKFCLKLGYKPTEMFSLLQGGGDALEMKKYYVYVAHMVYARTKEHLRWP